MADPITANDEHLALLTLYRSNEPRMTMARVEEVEVDIPEDAAGDHAFARGKIMIEAQQRNLGKLVISPQLVTSEEDKDGREIARAKVVILDMVDARDG